MMTRRMRILVLAGGLPVAAALGCDADDEVSQAGAASASSPWQVVSREVAALEAMELETFGASPADADCQCETVEPDPDCDYAYYPANLVCDLYGIDESGDHLYRRRGHDVGDALWDVYDDVVLHCNVPAVNYSLAGYDSDDIGSVVLYAIKGYGAQNVNCELRSKTTSSTGNGTSRGTCFLLPGSMPGEPGACNISNMAHEDPADRIPWTHPLVWLQCSFDTMDPEADASVAVGVRVCYDVYNE